MQTGAQYSLLDEKLTRLGCSFNCDDHIRFHIRMKPDVNVNVFLEHIQLYLNVGQINLYNESLPVSLTLFLGKTRKVVDETVVTTYALRLSILKQPF